MKPLSSDRIKYSLYTMMDAFSSDSAKGWLYSAFDSFFLFNTLFEEQEVEWKKYILNLPQVSAEVNDIYCLGIIKRLPVSLGSKTLVSIPVLALHSKNTIFQEREGKRIYFPNIQNNIGQFRNYSDLAFTILFSSAAKKRLKKNYRAGLLFFYDETRNFRLVFLRKTTGNEYLSRSFFCSRFYENRIFYERLSRKFCSFEELCEAFSEKQLTSEFYTKVSQWLEYALSNKASFSFPAYSMEGITEEERKKEPLLRLLLRLIFIYFIKSSGLISPDLFSVDKLKTMLKFFDPNSDTQENFYRCILQNLFFATFNVQESKRKFIPSDFRGKHGGCGVKNRYRYSVEFINPESFINSYMLHIPFLNCSLFDCLDENIKSGKSKLYDGFSNTKRRQAHIPNSLFFGEHGLVTIFNSYDFTLENCTEREVTMTINPYIISMVLENLLAEARPEAAESARQKQGYYYLPRDLVEAIVKGAVQKFLKQKHFNFNDKTWNRLLSDDGTHIPLNDKKAESLIQAVLQCRIFDPCCGSGIFPLTIIKNLSSLVSHIKSQCQSWQRKILQKKKRILPEDIGENHREVLLLAQAEQETQDEQAVFGYHLNLTLLKNCIYGADIRSLSVMSTCLQCYVYLLSLQMKVFGKAIPLPNLEANFVTADTLITFNDKTINFSCNPMIQNIRSELKKTRIAFLRAATMSSREKWRKQDHELRIKLQENLLQILYGPDEASRKLPKISTSSQKDNELNESKMAQMAFQMAERDPYKQNVCSPFFDSEWMFNIVDGFDIIIGEPPYYGLAEEIAPAVARAGKFSEKKEYVDAIKNGELYLPFTEYSVSVYLKKHGVFAMIVP